MQFMLILTVFMRSIKKKKIKRNKFSYFLVILIDDVFWDATQYLFAELTTTLCVPTLKDFTLRFAIPFELVFKV